MSIFHKLLGLPINYKKILHKIEGYTQINLSFDKPSCNYSKFYTKIWLGNGQRKYFIDKSYFKGNDAFGKRVVEEKALRTALEIARDLEERNFKVTINNKELKKAKEKLDEMVAWTNTCQTVVNKPYQ